jgi:hypothetical protein
LSRADHALVKCREPPLSEGGTISGYSAGAQSCMSRTMRWVPLIIVAAAVAGCTRPAPPGADLARVLAGRTAGPPQSCIQTQPDLNLHAVDQTTIAYGLGSTIYVNHIGACPGLRELSTIIVVSATGSQYCRGDRIRANEPGSIIPGPTCNLGDWIPYKRS